jgi:hypothetical protein
MMKSSLPRTIGSQIGAGRARRAGLLLCLTLTMTACASDKKDATPAAATPPHAQGCIASGGGFLQAQLRGALSADLQWSNDHMQCEGGPRPDGHGLRMTLAGPLPGDGSATLRFIFGIGYRDVAAGAAQALPTNVTVIIEGGKQMFATRGDARCAVETLERAPLPVAAHRDRVHVRGYCTGPANELAGDSRLLIPTFEFTGVVNTGDDP